MNKRNLIKLIVQIVATAYGLLGVLWVGMALTFAIKGTMESDPFALFFMTPLFFVFGGIVVAVAWQNLRRFGPNAIKNLTFLVIYTLYSVLTPFPKPSHEATWKTNLLDITQFLVPLLLAFFLLSGQQETNSNHL
jgi:peptidoglycan/LPS O-acetylase OafA/YrhL